MVAGEKSSDAWALKAAENLIDLSLYLADCELQDDDIPWIAGNVASLFTTKADFNEFIRTCAAIPGDLKLWLIVS